MISDKVISTFTSNSSLIYMIDGTMSHTLNSYNLTWVMHEDYIYTAVILSNLLKMISFARGYCSTDTIIKNKHVELESVIMYIINMSGLFEYHF